MAASLEVVRGARGRSLVARPPSRLPGRAVTPNGEARGLDAEVSEDPAARRRELLAVMAICAAQARGERERGPCERGPCERRVRERRLVMVRDS